MLPTVAQDLWEYLSQTKKNILLYGMGNGADKILAVCAERGITVSGVFASDGFARGNLFHGMPVRTWSETKALYGAENCIVLLSFGTSREDVLENIQRVAAETELYAPDVPAFGNTLFTRAFYEAHIDEFASARALLSDEASCRIFDHILQFKLTGDIRYLLAAESDPDLIWRDILHPECIHTAADLGAYNGDTVRELIEQSHGTVREIYCMEPDARNAKKLIAYAETENRCRVIPLQKVAWQEETILYFDRSGNRNASLLSNRSEVLDTARAKVIAVSVTTLDRFLNGCLVDYIKYDVEGAEREALIGSRETIQNGHPTLMVSLYHRSEDLFSLPLQIKRDHPEYQGYYLRRLRGIPAWDINLYVTKDEVAENA